MTTTQDQEWFDNRIGKTVYMTGYVMDKPYVIKDDFDSATFYFLQEVKGCKFRDLTNEEITKTDEHGQPIEATIDSVRFVRYVKKSGRHSWKREIEFTKF